MSRFKSPWVAWLVILTFSFTAVIGAHVWNPIPALAWDVPDDQGHTGTKPDKPADTKCGEKDCTAQRSPVQIKQGNYVYSHQDLFIPGRGISLEVIRHYDSQDMYDGPFGYGWKWGLEIKLIEITDESGDQVTIRRGDGTRREFTRNPDGSYSPPAGWKDYLSKNDDGTFTWCESSSGNASGGLGTCYDFDSAGYLITIQDRNGNQMSFSYDGTGKLIQITDASGRSLTIAYGKNNKIASIKDPADRVFTYGYDASGNLTSYTDPMGNTTTYSYDTKHHLAKITDARGNTVTNIAYYVDDDYKNSDGTYRLKKDLYRVKSYTEYETTWTYTYDHERNTTYKEDDDGNTWTYTYNDHGQVLTERDPLRNTIIYVWDRNLNLTSITDPMGNKSTFQYDNKGRRVAMIDARGNTTTYTYHPTFNNLTGITDALGRTTTFELNENGYLTKMTDALGNVVSMTYDQYGQIATMTDPLGHITTHSFDIYGNLTTITDPLGNKTKMVYDIIGNLIKITDAKGHSTTFVYDLIRNRTSNINALGHTTTYSYDENSNLIRTTNANGSVTGIEYTAYNQVSKLINALNNAVAFTYNNKGYLVAFADANGSTTTKEYDAIGRLTKITDPLGNTIHYGYDSNSNLTSVKDPKGYIRNYTYDSRDYLSRIKFPDGTFETYSYDKAGNLVSLKDRKGNTFTYSYDVLDRLVTKTYPDNSRENYAYDASSNLVSATYNNSTVSFTYDDLLRITRIEQDGKPVLYEYDEVGNRTKLTHPGGRYLTYEYNALNFLERIKDNSGQVMVSYAYDRLGRRIQRDLQNGTQTLYEYNDEGELTNLVNRKSSSQEIITSFRYTYDNMGNRTSMATEKGTHLYNYDSLYQLTGVTYPAQYPFSDMLYNYDAAGNRISTQDGGTTDYTADNMNRYTNIGTTQYTFDANGNLSSDGTNTYEYDDEDKLIRVITPVGIVTYAYDAYGRRIAKNVNGSTTSYVYDGGSVIEEIDSSGESTHYLNGPGIDEIVSMIKPDSGTNYYYLLDGLGSVSNITDSAANIIESYNYDVYGRPYITDSSGNPITESVIGNSNMFTARTWDEAIGLYDYRARHYDPLIGRFLQEDPLRDSINMNFYNYVGNNPVNFIDPNGTQAIMYIALGMIILASWSIAISKARKAYGPSEDEIKLDERAAWAKKQKIDEDIIEKWSPQAKEDVKRIRDAVIENYKKLYDFQCNIAAKRTVQLILETLTLNDVRIGSYSTPGCDMNYVEVVPNTNAPILWIYVGPNAPNTDDPEPLFQRSDFGSKKNEDINRMVKNVRTYMLELLESRGMEDPVWRRICRPLPTPDDFK
jgi:RHS repeat-associated protein